MISMFSRAAADVALDMEDRAAKGQLDAARALAARLEIMADELMQWTRSPSLDVLREHAGTDNSDRPGED
jgi:hypothetical protein